MGTTIQNPGYIPGLPANELENDQLNQLENDGSYGTTPIVGPSPTPSLLQRRAAMIWGMVQLPLVKMVTVAKEMQVSVARPMRTPEVTTVVEVTTGEESLSTKAIIREH